MKYISPLKAIRKNCLECEEGPFGVKHCVITTCPLFPYRFGTNPNRKGLGRKGGNPNLKTLAGIRKNKQK